MATYISTMRINSQVLPVKIEVSTEKIEVKASDGTVWTLTLDLQPYCISFPQEEGREELYYSRNNERYFADLLRRVMDLDSYVKEIRSDVSKWQEADDLQGVLCKLQDVKKENDLEDLYPESDDPVQALLDDLKKKSPEGADFEFAKNRGWYCAHISVSETEGISLPIMHEEDVSMSYLRDFWSALDAIESVPNLPPEISAKFKAMRANEYQR